MENLFNTEIPIMYLAAGAALVVGWKTFKNVASVGMKAGQKFGYGMIAASLMAILGLGGVGTGIGDLASRGETIREVDANGIDVDRELVKFDGVVARLDKESKVIYPISVNTDEQRSSWSNMSDEERKFVWSLLREESTASVAPTPTELYESDVELVSYEPTGITPLQIKEDNPVLPIQATYGLLFASTGIVLTSMVTFFRRIQGNKFDKPIMHDHA